MMEEQYKAHYSSCVFYGQSTVTFSRNHISGDGEAIIFTLTFAVRSNQERLKQSFSFYCLRFLAISVFLYGVLESSIRTCHVLQLSFSILTSYYSDKQRTMYIP